MRIRESLSVVLLISVFNFCLRYYDTSPYARDRPTLGNLANSAHLFAVWFKSACLWKKAQLRSANARTLDVLSRLLCCAILSCLCTAFTAEVRAKGETVYVYVDITGGSQYCQLANAEV
jgi:hypothetical protein